MHMGPENDDDHFHISGYDGGDGGAHNAKGRQSQLAVNQQVIEEQVNGDGGDSSLHWDYGFTAFPEGTDIDLNQHKCGKTHQHHF